MKPEDYFKPGSVAFIQAQEAINVINAAKAAGLPEAEQYERSFMESLDLVKKNRNWSGFDANRKVIAGLAPQVQAMGKQKNEFAESANQLKIVLALFEASGGELKENQIKAIQSAAEMGDKGTIDAYSSALSKNTEKMIESNLPRTPEEQAKMDLDTQNLAAAKQKAEMEKEAAANTKLSLEETLKDKYKAIVAIKKDPDIKAAFGVPISRWVPGSDSSSLSAKVDQLSNQEWIASLIKTKAAGATFGALTEKEGAKLASAATLLSNPAALNYETANDELQKMAQSVKKLYKQSTGRDLKEEVEKETQPEKQAQINKENQSKMDRFRVPNPQ